jgi:hypothetical protein
MDQVVSIPVRVYVKGNAVAFTMPANAQPVRAQIAAASIGSKAA